MQDNNGTSGSDNGPVDWLTALQAAKEFNVNIRRIYRLIESKEVATERRGGKLHVSRQSLSQILRHEQMRQYVSEVIPADTTNQELKEAAGTQLLRMENERANLYAKVAESERTIGVLTERTRQFDTLTQEVSGLRKRVERLIQYRVLFWVMLALFVVVVVIMSAILYVNL
jgi:DNA repair exonuclease SbcCD ATPase subunit